MSSSFLQQAVSVNPSSKRMTVLGEVDQRFVISPNVDQLLKEIERVGLVEVEGGVNMTDEEQRM